MTFDYCQLTCGFSCLIFRCSGFLLNIPLFSICPRKPSTIVWGRLKSGHRLSQLSHAQPSPSVPAAGNPQTQHLKALGTSQQLFFLQSCCFCDSYSGAHRTHPAALEPGLYLCSFTIKPCCSVGTSARLCSTQTPHTFFRNFSFYRSGCFLPAAIHTLDMLRKNI